MISFSEDSSVLGTKSNQKPFFILHMVPLIGEYSCVWTFTTEDNDKEDKKWCKLFVMTSSLMLLSRPLIQQATQVTCFGILKTWSVLAKTLSCTGSGKELNKHPLLLIDCPPQLISVEDVVAQQHKNSCHNSKFVHLPSPMSYFMPMTRMESWAISICKKFKTKYSQT